MTAQDMENNGEQQLPDEPPRTFSDLVDALVIDVLSTRFASPYPENIVDQVCLAIESDVEWRRRYDELMKIPKVKDGSDGSWAVNNRITKSILKLTEMEVVGNPIPATNKLMKSFSRLRPPDVAELGGSSMAVGPFERAVERLRAGLPALEATSDLAAIQRSRDEVYARYGRSFAPEQLPHLAADEYLSFLLFENNRHWTGINRHGSRTVQDMPALREALAILLDEGAPLAERYDQATGGMVAGVGRAIATAVLHVVYPEQYGVWNAKVEAGLRELGVYPDRPPKTTNGQLYAAVNEVLQRLAAALEIDLWTLDNLWEWMARRKSLAAPFDAIFADRAQAEWAFDLFADAVERLGGGPDDERFALTLRHGDAMMRLNIGNSVALDISNRGEVIHLTALIDEMESTFNFDRSENFRVTVKGTNKQFAIYTIPSDVIRQWPAELQTILDHSMEAFGKEFTQWQKSNLRWAHQKNIFEALFDEEKRDQLLTRGLMKKAVSLNTDDPPPPSPVIANEFKGFTPDAFAFLRELAENNNKAWMEANRERWKASVLEPMRALFADLGPYVKKLFDPYLLPDELEVAPTAHKVLARINKNWSATPDSKYHEYYWGAFYRQGLSRQTDAQLFINILPDHLRFGFYVGEQAKKPRARLRERTLGDPEGFFNLITDLDLVDSFDFIRTIPHGRQEMITIHTANDVTQWVENGNFDALMPLTPDEAVVQGASLADTIFSAFRRVFPVYLWAVADDYQTLVERYLSAEFPVDDVDEDEPSPTPYYRTDFLRHTHLTEARADELRAMVEDKRQAIFYGPPGTGKTYVAKHLARLLTGLADPPPDRLTVVQFHSAYGYEEFIEGIRPESVELDGRHHVTYPPRPGIFVEFCRAAERINGPCVFIIDEINRGNIPRIFGELMYLLEYRDKQDSIPLPYSARRFRIPPNVYLIGTMNTADRSIALVDFALRRRFHFAHFTADPDLFESWLKVHPSPVPWLGALYRRLTAEAVDDPDYAIGPSVFMRPGLDEDGLRRVWEWSVLPYLREYHIDRREAVEPWEWDSPQMRDLRRLAGAEPGADGDA